MDPSVTLVIKAPNQRFEDHTVDCMLDWTVRKLKQHLTNVYPSKPNELHQKLIYSGKLLQDHLTLKEVLRQFDDGSNKHTVHLVCSVSPQMEAKSYSSNNTRESQTYTRQSSSSSNTSQASPDPSGLRYRGHSPVSPDQAASASPNQNVFNQYSMPQMSFTPPQFAGGFSPETAMFSAMMPPSPSGYSPEQYAWMQQMYAQYMAQYMQYYQQAGYPTPPPTPSLQAAPQQYPAQENQAEGDAAFGGDMEDEEFQNRDWLDYLYMFSRFMVLIGIVYFYSNFTRFLMVAVFFLAMYGFQMGWFRGRPRRNQPVNGQEPVNQQAQEIPAPENVNPQPDNTQAANVDGNEEGLNPDSSSTNPTDPPTPPAPGKLQVTLTFLVSFFTSLLPSPPPAVNAN
ncbi:homocysteine-responsive endoplasmic reticulum-resident ubiquitin-like domain member 2 protein [Mya arenaria]|uniref:homocysteine-responsive endoplasmic reticulum-resident ubiquitin-like domain member 2 protein n=1 Tax=Mya arenaria TaxID=6604 RepID=UPI0022DFDE1C|nr:homocysteine-responsive endoplasmic reticulum-resident ubiquitin-like domain member 2 protein [Mya arenaria]